MDQENQEDEISPLMCAMANVLHKALDNKGYGFALWVFPFGKGNIPMQASYVSDGDREDVISMLKDFIAQYDISQQSVQ